MRALPDWGYVSKDATTTEREPNDEQRKTPKYSKRVGFQFQFQFNLLSTNKIISYRKQLQQQIPNSKAQ